MVWEKLAAGAVKPLFCFRGYSACGRATFQRRKVAKVLRACGPGPRRVALFRWCSRSARCPHEQCLTVITAVLLSEPTRLLLQGTMRLSGATYTVGSGRRAATWGRPYEILHPFRGAFPWGNSTKGAEAPFWSFQGDRVLRERGPIPPIRGKCRAQRDKEGRDNSKSPSPLTALW